MGYYQNDVVLFQFLLNYDYYLYQGQSIFSNGPADSCWIYFRRNLLDNWKIWTGPLKSRPQPDTANLEPVRE